MHNYSDSNRWSQSFVDGQLAMEYQYNPLGQRIAKSSGGVLQERYDYGANGELNVVRDGQNNPLRHYIYMNGKLVGLYDYTVSQLFYVHHDHLGTPHKVTNQAQQVVWSADYRPFGEVESVGGEEVFSRFPGQYHDVETGFYYNYFRDYDPSLGRYLQSDPIGLEGGINTYAYVGGNPVRYSDRLGLINDNSRHTGLPPAVAKELKKQKPVCKCEGKEHIDWACVNRTWAILNGGNLGVTAEATVGLGTTYWATTSQTTAASRGGGGRSHRWGLGKLYLAGSDTGMYRM